MKLNHIKIDFIMAEANKGAALPSCICEAVKVAMDAEKTVKLVHNQREYVIKQDAIVHHIERQNP